MKICCKLYENACCFLIYNPEKNIVNTDCWKCLNYWSL